MRIALSTVAAALISGLATAQPSRADEVDKYAKCARAALNRANAQNCDAYKEGIACDNKELQAIEEGVRGWTSAKAIALGQKAVADMRAAIEQDRKKAQADGCNVESARPSTYPSIPYPPSGSSPSAYPAIAEPPSPSSAVAQQSQQDQILCDSPDTTDDQTIVACTSTIKSGRLSGHGLANEFYNRGNAYLNKGALDGAIADYTQAIQLNPKADGAFFNRGNAYLNKGFLDSAIADYTQAIQLNPKYVEAYSNRGDAYRSKGDLDRAIADYTQTIQLNPKADLAYNNRGEAYKDKDDLDRAIADYTQAIQLSPKFVQPYIKRGDAYAAKGDLDRAMADYTQAIQLSPKSDALYLDRGRASLSLGALPKALADLNQASELAPNNGYAALWLDIVNRRTNLPSRLPEAIKQIDMTKWPGPVIRLYLGQLTPEAVLAAADDPDATTKKGQVCEANFYSGELALQRGAKDEAKRLLQLAVTGCPKSFMEYDGANAELKTLGASQ